MKDDKFSFGYLEYQIVMRHPSGGVHWNFSDI